MSDIAYTQNNTDQGELKIQVTARGSNRPITNARVAISYSGDPDSIVEEVNTDASGMSEQITLPAPPLEFSMEPGEEQPFSHLRPEGLALALSVVLDDTVGGIQDV